MPILNLPGAEQYVLQSSLNAMADEAYTNAKRINTSGIIGGATGIDVNTETFTGQLKWLKPLNPLVNVVSLTDPSPGLRTNFGSERSTYVKTLRSHGHEQVNQARLVSGQESLAKIARDFAETRADDENKALLAVLNGVAISEILTGAGTASGVSGLGGQTFENDPTNGAYGFYVDLGSSRLVEPASTVNQGAARCTALLRAVGCGFKDYEPDYLYLTCTPELLADLRSANLVDETKIAEGNVEFETLFGGKFRLLRTRANMGFTTAQLAKLNTGSGVDIVGTKTAFLIRPGSVAFQELAPEMPVEMTRTASSYKGGGSADIWYRWGYVLAPQCYDWVGPDKEFVTDDQYRSVKVGNTVSTVLTAATMAGATGVFRRASSSALSLGIMPVFHS